MLQAVNKINGVFTVEDEQTLEAFGHFCALILHNSSMQNEILRLENRHKVAIIVLLGSCPAITNPPGDY